MDEPDDYGVAVSPVTPAELAELQRFVGQTRRLADSSFFAGPVGKLTVSTKQGEGLTIAHPQPSDEAIRAVMPVFRQLYSDHDRGSAARAMNILKASARRRGTSEARLLIEMLRAHGRGLQELKRWNGGMQLVFNEEPWDYAAIIDLWLNGEHMHFDAEKASKLGAWPPGLLEFQLHGALMQFRNAFWVLANLVERCLAEPGLGGRAQAAAA